MQLNFPKISGESTKLWFGRAITLRGFADDDHAELTRTPAVIDMGVAEDHAIKAPASGGAHAEGGGELATLVPDDEPLLGTCGASESSLGPKDSRNRTPSDRG